MFNLSQNAKAVFNDGSHIAIHNMLIGKRYEDVTVKDEMPTSCFRDNKTVTGSCVFEMRSRGISNDPLTDIVYMQLAWGV